MEKMEANELRIGNYIDNYGKPMMWLMAHFAMANRGEIIIEKQNPIPLTEEWLIKFGFEKCGDYFNSENLDILQSPSKKNFLLSVGTEYTIGEPFEFVHQLQNLYFAITGEELPMRQ